LSEAHQNYKIDSKCDLITKHVVTNEFESCPELKIAVKRKRFEAVSYIRQTMTRELKTIREEAFSRALVSLYERCKHCAEVSGDYIE
jgi:hypothetical protein